MKKFVVVPLVLVLFAVWGMQSQAEIVDKIVAVVNSEIITLSELNTQAEPYMDRIEQTYKGNDKKRLVDEIQNKFVRKNS